MAKVPCEFYFRSLIGSGLGCVEDWVLHRLLFNFCSYLSVEKMRSIIPFDEEKNLFDWYCSSLIDCYVYLFSDWQGIYGTEEDLDRLEDLEQEAERIGLYIIRNPHGYKIIDGERKKLVEAVF